MPEHRARGLFLEMEQPHILADAAMIALFRLFEHLQIGVEFLLIAPCRAVDAAEHRLGVIAAPIGTGHLHQLERHADIAGGAHMRPTAEIEPLALLIEGDCLARRQIADQLGLEGLTACGEEFNRFLAIVFFAHEGGVLLDDLAHLGLDGREIRRGEGLVA